MKFSSHNLNLLLSSKYNEIHTSKTLRAVASEIGISAGYLALLRNGTKTNPGPNTIAKLCRYFNVQAAEFFERENELLVNAGFSPLKATLNLCNELISTDHADQAMDVLSSLLISHQDDLHTVNLYDEAILLRAVALSRIGDTEEGLRIIDDYIHGEHLINRVKSLAFYERSRIYYRMGYFDKSIADALNSITYLQNEEDTDLLKKLHYALGIYFGRISRFALSILHYERSRTFVEDPNNREAANILLGLGQTYLLMNEPHIAETYLLSAKEIYEITRNYPAVADVHHNLSRCKYLQENYEEATSIINQALKMHQDVQSTRGVAYDYIELARCSFKTGDYRTAQDIAHRASITFETVNDYGQASRARLIQYESMLCDGNDLSQVINEISNIICYFESHNWIKELGRAQRIYATFLESNGKHEEALKIYKQITSNYELYLDKIVFTD